MTPNFKVDISKYRNIGVYPSKDLPHLCKVRPTVFVENMVDKEIVVPVHYHSNHEMYSSMVLVCRGNDNRNSSSTPNNFVVGDSHPHPYPRECPKVYDYLGQPHSSKSLCVAASQESVCIFTLKHAIVTVCGGFMDFSHSYLIPYSFDHRSMGRTRPIYYDEVHLKWMLYYTDNTFINYTPYNMAVYDVVIPTRMIWDGNFGHLYHQSVPFIAHAFEFLPKDLLARAHWHCSTQTAALLMLLNIPEDKLIIMRPFQKISKQQPIIAKQLVLPWVSGWCPTTIPSLYGVANRILKVMTENLMLKFHDASPRVVKKLIIYLPRYGQTRAVANEDVIIDVLKNAVNREVYDFVVVNKTQEFRTPKELHAIWYQFAKVFTRARVVIGAHGEDH